mgnify:CR=1 FL=1
MPLWQTRQLTNRKTIEVIHFFSAVLDILYDQRAPFQQRDPCQTPSSANVVLLNLSGIRVRSHRAAASDVVPKFVAPSDPAAQWTGAQKSKAIFAYADNYLIDVKFGIIMDVEASRAITQAEVGASRTNCEVTFHHGSR